MFPAWRHDPERVIQVVRTVRTFHGAWVEPRFSDTDSVRGTEAWDDIVHHLVAGRRPYVDGDSGICGYYTSERERVEFWDCDEQTYSEMFGE